MKKIQLLSVALIAIMALTIVSGAGVLTAQATPTNPTSAEIAEALDVSPQDWTFTWTVNNYYATMPKSTVQTVSPASGYEGSDMVQMQAFGLLYPNQAYWAGNATVQTTVTGPGELEFNWGCWYGTNTLPTSPANLKFELFDGVQLIASISVPTVEQTHTDTSVMLGEGVHNLMWRLTATPSLAQPQVSGVYWVVGVLDHLRWNEVTKESVLADLSTLRSTVNSIPWCAFYPGTKYVLLNTIDTAMWQVKYGMYGAAAYTLQSKFVTRTDGCVLRGHPDLTDYVRTCNAQKQLYGQATDIIADLKWLQSNPS